MKQVSILLIEDDPDDVELMKEALKTAEIEYLMNTLREGNSVLPYLESCKDFPNVIVLDLNIPKIHGREVLQLLKKSERFKSIPVAVLTTGASQKERDNCLRDGADQFVTKPSTLEGLSRAIRKIIDNTLSPRSRA